MRRGSGHSSRYDASVPPPTEPAVASADDAAEPSATTSGGVADVTLAISRVGSRKGRPSASCAVREWPLSDTTTA